MIPPHELPAISLLSLAHFAASLAWALVIFVAIAGYGAAALRRFELGPNTFALAAATGFPIAVLSGGILNLLHLIRPAVLLPLITVGLALAAWKLRPRPTTEQPRPWALGTKILVVALLLVSGIRIAATVHSVYYQQQDDYNFYLAAPEKMVAIHSYAADPFSERRVTSSIGGGPFLDALILLTQPVECSQMGDWTLGALLLLVLAFAVGREFDLTFGQTCAFALLLMIMPQVRLNITPVILPSALFVGAVYVAAHRKLTQSYPVLQACLLGGAVGAITSLKSTYVPHGVIFIACLAGLRWWKRGLPAALRLMVVAALGCLVTMVPWMIANHQTSGTWLYPVLGRGFDYSAYGAYPTPSAHDMRILTHKVVPFTLPIFALFLVEVFVCERDERSYSAAALTLAAFVATLLVGFATGGDSMKRYNFPCILPAVCLLFVLCARRANLLSNTRRQQLLQGAAALFIVGVALTVGLSSFTYEYKNTLLSLRTSLADYRISDAALRSEYSAMQRAIPPEGIALTTLTAPYLLDFTSSQTLLLGDFPGAASPRPGWPAKQPGDALAGFLLAQGIRYLAFGYGECPPHDTAETCTQLNERLDKPGPNASQLIRSEFAAGHDAIVQYEELARTRPHIYDDGRIYVLDLVQ